MKRKSVVVGYRLAILRFLGEFCVLCRKTTRLEIDHIVPASKGGEDRLNNYQILCNVCNGAKHLRATDYRK